MVMVTVMVTVAVTVTVTVTVTVIDGDGDNYSDGDGDGDDDSDGDGDGDNDPTQLKQYTTLGWRGTQGEEDLSFQPALHLIYQISCGRCTKPSCGSCHESW